MLHVALWEPEIPPNTGNIARTCAATGVRLHLIGRLGFSMDSSALRRAGIDYWHAVDVVQHATFEDFEGIIEGKIWCIETPHEKPYTQAEIADGDCLLFGNESSGLPLFVRERYATRLVGIPMPSGAVRSLNLATSVGIVLYDALRRLHGW